ncbi:DEAD/DEAH box helicase [Siphonobacter sp. BAB-5385]|uniref:SNF2-related protein n=1 Tax=Siphonobacter sp. BAB-5385 TaxID=1864822 RepID=UPI000B9EB20A|nr:DEAD/DEAH box helicase [Siphonobacter sp. BAB-5385]OZI06613.1 DEAD/DEAH box helicase [Siphonobacter sp. BAB-5385]
MAVKTYGEIIYAAEQNQFTITRADPHVCIKLKHLFTRIPTYATAPFYFATTPEVCADLEWFLSRYPMLCSVSTQRRIAEGKARFEQDVNDLEAIHLPDYQPPVTVLKGGFTARDYQVKAKETYLKVKRLLLGDDLGLGKTLSGILSFLHPDTLPAVVVVQTHMPKQWKEEGIEKFTNLKAHIIQGTKPYSLPAADVYILKYSCLAGWVDVYGKGLFKSVIFDECQELRVDGTAKYNAARTLASNVDYCMGLSATPVYNYGNEIYNILDLINPRCLGDRDEFNREWTTLVGMKRKVNDPKALGSYLRERFLMLRRTRADVGRELPPINKIVHTVGYDEAEVKKSEELAKELAMKVMEGSFIEKGEAARELDMLARYTTGISKARSVAQYVRILLENEEPVVLAGWHRDVYDIWLKELADFDPVMYTGTESGPQKEKAKQAFVSGETNLFIISLRSGAGLDGLQHRCKTVVIGELDWSPKVHDQLIGRVDRDGQENQVTAIYLVSDSGSDPVIINLLGLKSSQANGIVDPLSTPAEQFSDDSRMKALAKQYLSIREVLK